MPRSLAVLAYLGASTLAYGLAVGIVRRRLARGKEHPERWRERLGMATRPRPKGALIWFHAASVGEALSLIDLIERLLVAREDLHVLVTTGTVTSAEVMEARLPERAFHQFVPVDARRAVRRFLDHWRPDAAVWTESELWPALLHYTHRTGCPMFLVNARLSKRSARRMRWLGRYGASLFGRFERILAQDAIVAVRLRMLGAAPDRVEVAGSLKEAAAPLPVDEAHQAEFAKGLAGKLLWCAASTHPGEEEVIATGHRQARRAFHGLILILVPRHPERGPGIAADLRARDWRVALRSAGEALERDTEIYVADTLGELGLWYRLAPVSFVGGSLVPVGGHNPYEPALLGSAIMHGPEVSNFETAYRRFSEADGAVVVPDAAALGPKLIETLAPDRTAELAAAAWRVATDGSDVAGRFCEMLLARLDREE